MQVYVLGGFLGSGKTTILMRIVNDFLAHGKKVAVIVNEIGDIGVDGTTLRSEGYNTMELAEGCVCCTLSASLQVATYNIIRDLNPDVLVIEPTGLAIPEKVAEALAEEPLNLKTKKIGVADGIRFKIFITKKPEFIKEQLECSDMIIINKIDIATEEDIANIESWIAENVGDIRTVKISALTGEGLDLLKEAVSDE